jgi:poly(hydroxyalkanoate) depolymerase family esterase
MKSLLLLIVAAWRAWWLAWLRLLAAPWRWLVGLLGAGRARPQAREDAPAARPTDDVVAPTMVRDLVVDRAAAGGDTELAERAERGPPPETEPPVDDDSAPTFPSPPPAPTLGQFVETTFRTDAGERHYKLYLPPGKAEQPLPLVVMLHGCKQNPDDFAAGTRMNLRADEQGVLVLYPAQTKAANSYACWNWFRRHDQHRDEGEPALIAAMVHAVMVGHPVDPQRVYLAGLSAGGAMAATLAHTYPELFAAVGVHSGLAYGAAQDAITALGVMKRGTPGPVQKPRARPGEKRSGAKNGVPMIVFHGDHDKVVHPLNGERVVEQALESARSATARDSGHPVSHIGRVPGGHAWTRTTYTNRAGQVHVEHWVVQGSGHAWSGGDKAGSFTDPLGPDASSEMLRFFFERKKA